MKKAELLFIPSPGLSHLVSAVESAKLLLRRDQRLSVVILTMKLAGDSAVDAYKNKIIPPPRRLRFIDLPTQEEIAPPNSSVFQYIESQMNPIKEIISDNASSLSGVVLDMFCTKFMPIADEFNLRSYVFFSSGACCLGMYLHLVALKFDFNQELSEYKRTPEIELSIPCFSNPVPAKVLPAVLIQGGYFSSLFMDYFRRLRDAAGILVNTFQELENAAIESMNSDGKLPKLYPIGPILNLENDEGNNRFGDVKKWLDDQPEKSVVFLCFGTMGSFQTPQVREIAAAQEKTGSRFLWSLRKPPEKGATPFPTEYQDYDEVLPEGFPERTEGIGKIIGWAPQTAILAHRSIGGFVSHCGWNSVLESVWFGVPVATFPLSAEQQANAFELVKELKMAEPIRIDYRHGENPPEIVTAAEIEIAVLRLMGTDGGGGGGGVRENVKEMQRKSRLAMAEGGSSYHAQTLFIQNL
ncbi:hypothetical protein M569_08556, partial [Genlisea aurea]